MDPYVKMSNAAGDPVSLAMYALKNDLLDVPGWKHLRRHVKNPKKFARMVHQAKLKAIRTHFSTPRKAVRGVTDKIDKQDKQDKQIR